MAHQKCIQQSCFKTFSRISLISHPCFLYLSLIICAVLYLLSVISLLILILPTCIFPSSEKYQKGFHSRKNARHLKVWDIWESHPFCTVSLSSGSLTPYCLLQNKVRLIELAVQVLRGRGRFQGKVQQLLLRGADGRAGRGALSVLTALRPNKAEHQSISLLQNS